MRTLLPLAGALLLAAAVSGQQPTRDNGAAAAPAAGTSAISGIVVTTDRTPQPIRRATVAIAADGAWSRLITSDEEGRFVFDNLPAGRFTLMAARPGYVRMPYGAPRYDRGGTPIVLTVGQRVTDIRIALPLGAVIAGTVRDEKGQPVRDVSVRLHQFRQQGTERVLVTPPITAAGGLVSAQTDDLGGYRLFGLPAGEYVVSAVPRNTVAAAAVRGTIAANPRTWTYAPVFFPGTAVVSDAGVITLAAGKERSSIDVSLLLVSTGSISGRVVSPAGSPRGTTVRLVSRAALSQPTVAFSMGVTVADDGQFVFSPVSPGDYTVTATVPGVPRAMITGATPAALAGQTDVSVNGVDVRDVTVALQPTSSLSGRLTFDGAPVPPDISSRLRLAIAPADSVSPVSHFVAEVTPSGQFAINGVPPGLYRFVASMNDAADQSWSMATAVAKGADALDLPFEILFGESVTGVTVTFTRQIQEVSGVLQNATGAPATDFTLIVFPADRAYWGTARRTQTARPGTDGRFIMRGLPPGDYVIAALTDLNPNDVGNPSVLELITPHAIRFTLKAGEKRTQDFRVGAQQQ